MIKIIHTQERKCGRRKAGGVYLVSPETSPDGVLQQFTPIDPPIPYPVKAHRVPRIVDKVAVLARLPLEDWWYGSSKETEQEKSANQWALETFGMTLAQRLKTGECYGLTGPDDAIALLASKITLTNRAKIVDLFRKLTHAKVQERPRTVQHYESLYENLAVFLGGEETIDRLMAAQAATWRIAYNTPPSEWVNVVTPLASILYLLNLKNDATALLEKFSA